MDAQKKTLAACERDEGLRCRYRLQILQQAADRFVVVDESGYNLDFTVRYARAPPDNVRWITRRVIPLLTPR